VRYLKLSEVCLRLEVDEALLRTLQEEGLIQVKRTAEEEPVISVADAERLRVSLVLLREMDVNLAGVEVVLQMREHLQAMQRQFDEILRSLVEELRKRVGHSQE